VATGEGLAPAQQERIDTAVQTARQENGLDISVLVGDLALTDISEFRAAAERLHAALGERSRSAVLIVVAPGQRRVEIVTGPGVRRRVPDRVCALALLSMTTAFTGGDLAGGIVTGIRQIADAAGRREPVSIGEAKRSQVARHEDSVAGSRSAPAAGAGQH
jgi:uncharacterized membrane protein YgcG